MEELAGVVFSQHGDKHYHLLMFADQVTVKGSLQGLAEKAGTGDDFSHTVLGFLLFKVLRDSTKEVHV